MVLQRTDRGVSTGEAGGTGRTPKQEGEKGRRKGKGKERTFLKMPPANFFA
jgi:hypothetical protein